MTSLGPDILKILDLTNDSEVINLTKDHEIIDINGNWKSLPAIDVIHSSAAGRMVMDQLILFTSLTLYLSSGNTTLVTRR